MIILQPIKLEWDSDDRKVLLDFLNSRAGTRALQWLDFFKPGFDSGENPNKTLVAAGRVEGYQEALTALVTLTVERPPETEPTEEYPDTDDDSKWPQHLGGTQGATKPS